tara:strand:+ start:1207 stop:2556 length:1350 start_codon:yes stop_codon:yes gene_type:complete
MISPSNRLLLWCAWLVLPCALVSALGNAYLAGALALFLFGLLLALIDFYRGAHYPKTLLVHLPALTRYSRHRAGRFEVTIESTVARTRPYGLRVGLSVPEGLNVEEPIQSVTLPGAIGRYPLPWTCTPQRRGKFSFDGAYIECLSPWGLWMFRRHVGNVAEIRVYPNLIPERNRMASAFLNRTGVGAHAQRQVGKGREFEQLREYIPGDSYEDIHWKATARRGFPITKTYQIERTQEVYVIVDSSRLSARTIPGSGPNGTAEAQLEHTLSAALLLGVVAERQGDFFGLATFSDRVHTFIRASKGRGHFNSCREALYTLEPQRVNPDFEEICTFIRLRLRRRALLIFLTNLDDPVLAESFSKNLDLLANRHLVMVNMITPSHVRPVFSQGQVSNIDEVYRHLGGHLQWHNLRETQRTLFRHGVDLHLANHESLCADMVSQYVSVKQRQAL